MFILMKYSKMEGTRTRTTAHRVGLFRTRRGANKVMARLVEQEKKKPVPASFGMRQLMPIGIGKIESMRSY